MNDLKAKGREGDWSQCITNRIYIRQKYKIQKKKASQVQIAHTNCKSWITEYFCVALFCTESGSDEKTYLAFEDQCLTGIVLNWGESNTFDDG